MRDRLLHCILDTYLYVFISNGSPESVSTSEIGVGLLDDACPLCVVGPLGLSELQLIQIGKCQPHGADPLLRSSATGFDLHHTLLEANISHVFLLSLRRPRAGSRSARQSVLHTIV